MRGPGPRPRDPPTVPTPNAAGAALPTHAVAPWTIPRRGARSRGSWQTIHQAQPQRPSAVTALTPAGAAYLRANPRAYEFPRAAFPAVNQVSEFTAARIPTPRRSELARYAPPANWRELVGGSEATAALLWRGLAPNTRVQYEAQITKYSNYARRQGWPTPYFPASESQVADWIAALAFQRGDETKKLTHGSLEAALTALSSWHTDLGLDASGVRSRKVARVVRGAHKAFGLKPVERVLPITLPILRTLLRYMERNPGPFGGHLPCLALRTAFALAFACFLRMGEFTFDLNTFDPGKHLTRDSVSLCPTGSHGCYSTLLLRHSKTDTFEEGVKVVIPVGPVDVCPVALLRQWLSVSPLRKGKDPLFTLPGGSFKREDVISALRVALRETGFAAGEYSGHSFRRGAATWCASIGMPEKDIQVLGRWSSWAVRKYMDLSPQAINAIAARFISASARDSTLPDSGVPGPQDIWVPRS